ncbi:MAG: alpha/beta hydrolase-fold protein [Polyangiales bacterium]
MRGTLHQLTIESECLRANKLGDPSQRTLYVYEPNTGMSKRLPVVMMLAGFGGTNHSIVAWDPWKQNTISLYDRLVDEGKASPAYLVMPDAFNRWGGSQFLDSAATGSYQTYLADEIIPFVDKHFRSIPNREARAVAGRSSGGFGALRLAIDRPDTVVAVGAHAADADFEVTMRPMLTSAAIAMAAAGGVEAFAHAIVHGGPRTPQQFDALFVLAASAAYTDAAIDAFPFAELPINVETGELVASGWQNWINHDPLTLLERRADALGSLGYAFIDAGDVDEHGLQFAARKLAQLCRNRGVPTDFEIFDGGHRGTSFRYENSLPKLISALATE